MNESVDAARNTRCHRCGGLLGMGTIRLSYWELTQAGEIPKDPTRILESLRRQLGWRRRGWRRSDLSTFCQSCGDHSQGVTLTPPSPPGPLPTITRIFSRISEDTAGRIDVARLLARADFPVYGLKVSPLGLRLRDLGWVGARNRRSIVQVRFRYVAGGHNGPPRAVELTQMGIGGETAGDRLFAELQAIVGLVTSHGSEELRREYQRKGNVHRDWNLARISRTPRRRLTVEMSGVRAEVELAYWWKPQPAALAQVTLGRHPVLATSVGLTHIQLLTLLKTMTALQRDPGTLDDHQRAYDEARSSRSSYG